MSTVQPNYEGIGSDTRYLLQLGHRILVPVTPISLSLSQAQTHGYSCRFSGAKQSGRHRSSRGKEVEMTRKSNLNLVIRKHCLVQMSR